MNPFNLLRKIYHWTLKWAEHRHGPKALCVISFAEASFFPIPPDVLLLAMGAAQPKKSFWYATLCSISSVIGGIFGFFIGSFLWHIVHPFFFKYVFSQEVFDKVAKLYADNAFEALFLAAFTPIPYKAFTVAAGVFEISLATLILASCVGRSLRFFMVAATLYFFGAQMKVYVEKYFELLTVLFSILLIGGFYFIKVL